MKNKTELLEKKLVVGAKIKIGKKYSELFGFKEGEIITLIEGCFENDNGLYTETETCPAIWCEVQKDFDSIYHLFGNKLEFFLDCEIVDNINEERAISFSKENLKTVNSLLSEDYKIGYKEGVEHYLDSIKTIYTVIPYFSNNIDVNQNDVKSFTDKLKAERYSYTLNYGFDIIENELT